MKWQTATLSSDQGSVSRICSILRRKIWRISWNRLKLAAQVRQDFPPRRNPIPFLRTTALIEAVSFLVLLGVAMPLKYVWRMPSAVKIVGWIHGVLFILFCVALLRTVILARWPLSRAALIFVAALLPFGPFVIDRRIRQYQHQFLHQQK